MALVLFNTVVLNNAAGKNMFYLMNLLFFRNR